MDEDLVRTALRRDADMLLECSPNPDAAALWHRIRRARAQRLNRILDICGWSVRAGLAASAVGVAFLAPDALILLAGPLVLAAWLSTGICSPVLAHRR